MDYTRSLTTNYSPAIDPLFEAIIIIDEGGGLNYPFYWTSTTHANMMNGAGGVYIAFGEALGWMSSPWGGNYELMDVHGAGAQRSDPKSGDLGDYPYGHGPQGDVIRIFNHVRLVRGGDAITIDNLESAPDQGTLPDQEIGFRNPLTPFQQRIKISVP